MATEQQKKYTNYNAFRKRSYERNPFEDPTYLSFTISFVYDKGAGSSYHNMLGASPLFNGKAYDYLKDFCMDDDRAYSLEKFTELLRNINSDMPWTWQSLSGLENTTKLNKMIEPFKGGEEDDNKLTIECLETYDLMMTGLIDLYKHAAYDTKRWVEVLPHNMRRFSMIITVGDCRTIQTSILNSHAKQTSDKGSDARDYIKINSSVSAAYKPMVAFHLHGCEFDVEENMSTILADLKAGEAPEAAKQQLVIRYQKVEDIEVKYLNHLGEFHRHHGRWEEPVANPEIDGETYEEVNPGDSLENILGKEAKNEDIQEKQNLLQKLKAKAEAIGENISDRVGGIDIAGDLAARGEAMVMNAADDLIAGAILGNVHGGNTISNVQDALNSGGINGIANLINKETSGGATESGDLVSTNINPQTDPENPLTSENVNPPSKDESGLSSTNIHE